MRFSENWLREWVNPNITTQALCDLLTMAGLEVDSVNKVADEFKNVVVGLVKSKTKHPDADKLSICEIDLGKAGVKTIVCGAKNIQEGMKVSVAQVGAYLPVMHKVGETLGKATLKGVLSEGMVCSATEIGLSESSEGILPLHPDAPVGESVWDYLKLNDTEIEVDLTPNRGDCLSILGIARDVGALTKSSVVEPEFKVTLPKSDRVRQVNLKAHQHCPKYAGRVIEGVEASAKTPDWMLEKLRRSGIRGINIIVDIMNFVMLEIGQPMHAFDLAKIDGDITVRLAKKDEPITLLDGQEVTLKDGTLVIADNQSALAMAGIMGGEFSAVETTTQNIFLESAFFAPQLIAGCARQYGLFTDSAFRFERGVDPSLQTVAIERATQLILEMCGGVPGPVMVAESQSDLPIFNAIPLSLSRVHRLVGQNIAAKEVEAVLISLGCVLNKGPMQNDLPSWEVLPPTYRFDFAIEEDLVEELCRVIGYNNIQSTMPNAPLMMPEPNLKANLIQRFKRAMVDMGYSEAITYSFVDPKLQKLLDPAEEALALLNPISHDLSEMRTSLWPGLVGALKYNQNRQAHDIRLFEVGLRFKVEKGNLIQEQAFSGICVGNEHTVCWQQKQKRVDFYDVKGHLETLWRLTGKSLSLLTWKKATHPALHPGQSAEMIYNGKVVGLLGAIHPGLLQKLSLTGPIFMFEFLTESFSVSEKTNFIKPSKYPEIGRDLSFTVPNTQNVGEIIDFVENNVGELLQDVSIFDIYSGKGIEPGLKSVALGLTLQHASRTLVEEEVETLMHKLVLDLNQNFGAKLRD